MNMVERLRRFIRARVKRWGPASAVRSVWDSEFEEGWWDYIEETACDCVYPYIEKYCGGGAILDLGCGSGNTGNELSIDAYKQYTGVDLSDVAVRRAKARTERNGRSDKNHYQQGDIARYEASQPFEVILFRESLWYIPRGRLESVLDRYRQYLAPSGVFIVRVHDRFRFVGIVHLIKEHYQLVEEYEPNNAKDVILVFR